MSDDFDPNLELYPEWRQALKMFLEAKFTYGDIVPHDWFYTAFGLEVPHEKMTYGQVKTIQLKRLSQFEKLQEALLTQHQIDLQPDPGVGYALVPPADQSVRAVKDTFREVSKAYRKGMARAVNVSTALLTSEQRREHADHLAHLAMMGRMLKPPRELPPADDE
jgi:hypothetical protein